MFRKHIWAMRDQNWRFGVKRGQTRNIFCKTVKVCLSDLVTTSKRTGKQSFRVATGTRSLKRTGERPVSEPESVDLLRSSCGLRSCRDPWWSGFRRCAGVVLGDIGSFLRYRCFRVRLALI
ncbi:hypothetical protein MTR_4g107300 [Medicago truncatula]|uniref:Uncharacterized protein n=1 Tax=Medicago truncatula TaxID=3880 RepID=A0A072URC3_MEDTR|nr:hypothetical protein MTR_4g107300 [Medicago truncatula]